MTDTETTPTEPPACAAAGHGCAAALNRRSLLKGIAVAGAAAVPLFACGGSSNAEGPPPSSSASRTPTRSPSSKASGGGGGAEVITQVAKVPVGGGIILPAKTIVVTQPTKGTFEGFSSTCTHMGCTVGTISDGKIICPCHGSMYSIKDGHVVGGPAPQSLPPKPVKVEGANIVLA